MIQKFLFSSILLMGTLGAEESGDKQKDIVELIRISSLNSEQLDQILPQMVQLTLGADANSQKIVAELKAKIESEDFIKKYVSGFDRNFTHEEIKILLAYYKE